MIFLMLYYTLYHIFENCQYIVWYDFHFCILRHIKNAEKANYCTQILLTPKVNDKGDFCKRCTKITPYILETA